MNFLRVMQETTSWNLPILALLLFVVFIYVGICKKDTPFVHPILFCLSLLILYVLIGSPYVSIVELSFSLHMIQMGLLYFIIPPLLIAGIPTYIYDKHSSCFGEKTFFIPISMMYVFAVLLFFYHLPSIMNVLLPHPPMLLTYKAILFFLACGMWWPIVTCRPRNQREKGRLTRYTSLCTLLISPTCLLLIVTAFIDSNSHAFFTQFSAHLCVPASHMHALLPPFFQSKTDQWLAGLCMFTLHSCGVYLTNHLPKEQT